MISRHLYKAIKDACFKGKVVILYGPRQTGKTTLCKALLSEFSEGHYLTCDEPDVRDALTNRSSTSLKQYLGNASLVVLDEAQRVKNIGLTLKLLHDHYPELQIIATGSSSFELANDISEPLTGRKVEFHLLGISVEEFSNYTSAAEMDRLLERRLIYGMYPDIVLTKGPEIVTRLKELSTSYLYKDVLGFGNLKRPEFLEKLLQALALQVGNEVSYLELGQLLGIDKNTISSYIQILEKAFIVFRLPSLSRNLRNEIKKYRKIYFYDNGIRNTLINNFNPLSLRQDTGSLWENFMIAERVKWAHNHQHYCNRFFWRTHTQQEIDYIEEFSGHLYAFEFKWTAKRKFSIPPAFSSHYPNSTYHVITPQNYRSFLNP